MHCLLCLVQLIGSDSGFLESQMKALMCVCVRDEFSNTEWLLLSFYKNNCSLFSGFVHISDFSVSKSQQRD